MPGNIRFGGRRVVVVTEIDRNEVIKRFVIVTADKLSAVSFPREIRIDDDDDDDDGDA